MPTNQLSYNPRTDGSSNDKWIERLGSILHDKAGNDIDSSNPLPVASFNSLVPEVYDEIVLTYVAAGNGAGEIETVTYKLSTVTVATLTLSYNGSNKLSGVVKS